MEHTTDITAQGAAAADWHYFFVHSAKIKPTLSRIAADGRFATFVHTTIRYSRTKSGVTGKETPTVGGLVFIQGDLEEILDYMAEKFPSLRLANDCATKRVATIPDSVMQPFMRVSAIEPTRVRVLLNPIGCYAQDRQRVRVVSGVLEGMEGYVVRINRDRRLVVAIGDMTLAISGAHNEPLEPVDMPMPNSAKS